MKLQVWCYQNRKFLFLSALLWVVAVSLTACTTSWIQQASTIVTLLEGAIPSFLAILAAFGVGLPANVMTQVNDWGSRAQAALVQVNTLIQNYNAAAAAAKPGILAEIQTALSVGVQDLSNLLPLIKVTDASTTAKITAVAQAILDEWTSLVNVIPVLSGQVSDHDQAKALVAAVGTAKEFKAQYNAAVAPFGVLYQLK